MTLMEVFNPGFGGAKPEDVCTQPPAAYVCVTPDVVVCAYPNMQFICIPAETPVKPPCNPPSAWF